MKTIMSLKPSLDEPRSKKSSEKWTVNLGNFIREARLEKGLTQEELARKCGTNKAYISKVENNQKDLRFSSFQKIVETGLNGEINITITL